MLPLKLRALSDESDESDSDTETPRITKELLVSVLLSLACVLLAQWNYYSPASSD